MKTNGKFSFHFGELNILDNSILKNKTQLKIIKFERIDLYNLRVFFFNS